jgi:hypothetical protein
MIVLSYSTINMLYKSSHNWINKMCGLKVPDNEFFRRGRDAHRIIQDHVCGDINYEGLSHIPYVFPIVEKVDFDPNCEIKFPVNDKYAIRGFIDGANKKTFQTLEIKTSAKCWSIGDFQRSMQRRIYSIALPWVKENILITAHFNPETWTLNRPKVFSIPVTEEDKKEAWEWIRGGIEIIEKGDFTGGLVNGVCVDRFCLYGSNCQFKQNI